MFLRCLLANFIGIILHIKCIKELRPHYFGFFPHNSSGLYFNVAGYLFANSLKLFVLSDFAELNYLRVALLSAVFSYT